MKLTSLLFFLFFFSVNFSLAKAALINPKFSYSYKKHEGQFSFELYQLVSFFEDENFSRLTATPGGPIPFLHVNEILRSSDNEGMIAISSQFIAPENIQEKIVELNESSGKVFLYHTKSASIAFYNMNEHLVNQYIGRFKKAEFVSRLKSVLINEAQADTVHCQTPSANQFKNLEAIPAKVEDSFLLKRLGECAVTALKSGGKSFEDTYEFFMKMKDNPFALWDSIKKSADSLLHLMSNMKQELMNFYQTMSGLSMDEKIDIGCTLIGQVGAGAIMSLTGAGAAVGSAKILAMVIPKLMRMKNMMLTFQRFKIPTKSLKETLSCAL